MMRTSTITLEEVENTATPVVEEKLMREKEKFVKEKCMKEKEKRNINIQEDMTGKVSLLQIMKMTTAGIVVDNPGVHHTKTATQTDIPSDMTIQTIKGTQ